MTSCHDVTKPDLPISACRCARKLILFLFLWFFGSLNSLTLLIFYLCDVVTPWRHVMTSQNLIYLLSQLVDVLEIWLFFVSMFLGHWVPKRYQFFICVMSWRHLSQLRNSLERGLFWFFRGFSCCVFLNFYRSCSYGMISCHNVTSWRHVIT